MGKLWPLRQKLLQPFTGEGKLPLDWWLSISLAVALRGALLTHETPDYNYYLSPWYDYIVNNQGFWALQDNFSNYTPPYLYALVFVAHYLAFLPKVVAIKLIVFPFEVLASVLIYRLVKLAYPQGPLAKLATLTFLFAPTVVLNGSYWGQCDIIYTTALLACLYCWATHRFMAANLSFGTAIAIKLQALWLGPALLIGVFKKQYSWQLMVWIPLTYGFWSLPAAIAGRPWGELWLIYFQQSQTFASLTLNAPNIYQWIPPQFYSQVLPWSLAGAIVVCGLFITIVSSFKFTVTFPLWLQISLISVILVPYCLPKMHDRYFFAADVISLVYGFYFPTYFWVPLALNGISLFSYFPYLWGQQPLPLNLLSLLLAAVIVALFLHLQDSFVASQNPLNPASGK